MRSRIKQQFVWICLLTAVNCTAATHYVVPPGTADITPTDPYTNWATAGTSIIDVVNVAMINTTPRIVWVTNGTYDFTNQVLTTNELTIQSVNGWTIQNVNGWTNTIFHGLGPEITNRAFYNNGPSALRLTLDGFTFTNFYATAIQGYRTTTIKNCLITGNRALGISSAGDGGAIYATYDGLITNCVIRGNYALRYGGAITIASSTAYIKNTLIEANSSGSGGGAIYDNGLCHLSNCEIINNRATGVGGGLYSINRLGSTTISDCVITGNACNSSGGGIYSTDATASLFKNCLIKGNSATNSGGGIYGYALGLTLRNCLISGNVALTNGGGMWWSRTGLVESCTIASNYAGVSAGGFYADSLTITGINNIIYHNTASDAANFTNTAGNTGLNYSCVFPAVAGTGNITNGPRLIDLAGGNYRLAADSPCINAGLNQDWMTNSVDLDGRTRIRYGRVDMGAYEVFRSGTIYGFH